MDSDELSQHLIYHPSSPSFDIPDYLPLRRVKPLPKRKRSSPDPAGPLPLNAMLPPILPPLPGPDATAEELIAHAEVLSAQITFQSYFLPAALSGVADFARSNVEASPPAEGVPVAVDLDVPPTEVRSKDTGGSGDHHLDQMQQQGNAKKRKVPAHLSGSQMGPDSSDVHSGEEEPPVERVLPGFASPTGSPATATAVEVAPEEEPSGAGTDGRLGKMLPATIVGLRQKEMLKHRKRQLAAALSAPMLGDSLALDQALLANYTLLNENRSGVSRNARLKSRLLMRRRPSRVVRRRRAQPAPHASSPARRIFPDNEFTFLRLNAASERLVATRTEYMVLYDRFDNEVVRQAEKAAETAKARAVAGTGAMGVAGAKRGERVVRKARAVAVQDTETPTASKSPSSTKTPGKKKKRSALANASNPHHLRNYVPSRIPNPSHLSAAQIGANTQNLLSPLPLLFLSAQIPPRRGAAQQQQQQRPMAAAPQLANPAEEWICPTCEYRLFYGDEQGYRIGLRNRKKILKRRRRARERAAAAANGSGTGVGAHGKGSGFDDEEDLDFETTGSGLALSQTRLAKVEREKDGDNLGLGLGGAG